MTGQLICEKLTEANIDFAVAGRDAGKLAALVEKFSIKSSFVCDVTDQPGLLRAMQGCSVVVNCAGPFAHLGEPVVLAAISSKIHYLDISGEQGFVRSMVERHESKARHAGIVVVPACGFEVALGDWAASMVSAALPGDSKPSLSISYATQHFRPTPGTQLSILDSVSSPGAVWNQDRWEDCPLAKDIKEVVFPEPWGERTCVSFPSAEVITVPRHIDAQRVQTFFALAGGLPLHNSAPKMAISAFSRLLGMASPFLPLVAQSQVGQFALAQLKSLVAQPSSEAFRGNNFAISVEATNGTQTRNMWITGKDAYGLTAVIVAKAAQSLANSPEFPIRGILAPSQVFRAETWLPQIAELANLTIQNLPAHDQIGSPLQQKND